MRRWKQTCICLMKPPPRKRFKKFNCKKLDWYEHLKLGTFTIIYIKEEMVVVKLEPVSFDTMMMFLMILHQSSLCSQDYSHPNIISTISIESHMKNMTSRFVENKISTSKNSKIPRNKFRWLLRSFLAEPLPPASEERALTLFMIFPFNPWTCENPSRFLLPSGVETSIDPLTSPENFSTLPISKIRASASPAAMRTDRSSLSRRLDKYDIDLQHYPKI